MLFRSSYELTPQADPNTASHAQRIMKIMALKQLQAAQPGLYDPIAVDTAALQAIGWNNPTQFMAPPNAQAAPPPEMMKMQADAKAKDMMAQAHMMDAQTRAQKAQAEIQLGREKLTSDTHLGVAKAQLDAHKVETDASLAGEEVDAKLDDKLTKERIQLVDLAQNLAVHPLSAGLVQPLVAPAFEDVTRRQAALDATRRRPLPGLGGAQAPGGMQ